MVHASAAPPVMAPMPSCETPTSDGAAAGAHWVGAAAEPRGLHPGTPTQSTLANPTASHVAYNHEAGLL